MGRMSNRRPENFPDVGVVRQHTSTAAIIQFRVVRLVATGNVKHTTGTSGRAVYGVAVTGATGAGRPVQVQRFGEATVEASSRAIAVGDWLRATSGAASTASRLGGTVRKSTSAVPNICGLAMTSCAAGAGLRRVTMWITPTINNGLNLV
jgi:hypothetical protein